MSTEPPNLDIEAMKARCDAAAHGPWQRVYGGDNSYEVATRQGLALAVKVHIADAEFMAHARMDVPTLIREVERIQAERDALHQQVQALQAQLQAARGALADIALSADMTLTLARKKANRVYIDTQEDKP